MIPQHLRQVALLRSAISDEFAGRGIASDVHFDGLTLVAIFLGRKVTCDWPKKTVLHDDSELHQRNAKAFVDSQFKEMN